MIHRHASSIETEQSTFAPVSIGSVAMVGTVFRLRDSAATKSKIDIYPPRQETEERPVDKDDRDEETFDSVECGT